MTKQDGFDINNLDNNDKNRIRSVLEKNNIYDIGLDQFIEHYKERSGNVKNDVLS